jgi:8-oxo-dGTP pyrophosphatase MutT (NUDIX family)
VRTTRANGILPGGWIEPGETAAQAAVRETLEETGFLTGHAGKWHCRTVKDIDATTYLFDVDSELRPRLDASHDDWAWVSVDKALEGQ